MTKTQVDNWYKIQQFPVVKGTLHFRNNLGSKDSLDPSEYRVRVKNLKFDLLQAKKSANIFEKNLQKSVLSLLEESNGFYVLKQSCLFFILEHIRNYTS